MIRVGIIGAGFIANVHAIAYENLQDQCKVVAVSDIREENARKLAARFGAQAYSNAEEMLRLSEIEMVDICLPTFLHAKYATKAAEAGKHILCEKPMALNSEDAQSMIEAAEKADVALMVAQVIRFWPEYVAIKNIIDSGELGEPLMIIGQRTATTPTYSWDNWLLDERRSGGAVMDLHIHDLDFAAYLLGEPVQIYAVGITNKYGVSHCSTSITFANGSHANLLGGWIMPEGYPFTTELSVVCEKGTVEFRNRAGVNIEKRDEGTSSLTIYGRGPQPEVVPVRKGDGYYNEIKYFIECVEKGKKPLKITPTSAKRSIEMVQAARQSVKTGRTVRL